MLYDKKEVGTRFWQCVKAWHRCYI